jgi:myo-inositol-1(or 4)-monophosphatase
MSNFQRELELAQTATRAAGDIIRESYAKLREGDVGEKAVNDLVTVVDVRAQETVVEHIRSAFPGDYIVAEEDLDPEVNKGIDPQGGRRWYIDPLDGTTNYIHAYPVFASSVALEVEGEMSVGVTYGPMMDEMFTGSRGGGAYLNGIPIRVSNVTAKNRTLFGTGFPFRARRYLDVYLESFKYFFNHSRGVRRGGSATLDFAYLAAGRLDAFWEMTLSPWDMAAGVVLIEEAGGRVTDFFGGSRYIEEGHVVASNNCFHDWMLEELGKVFTEGEDYQLRD